MRILAGIGALAIIVAVGAAIFFFGGFFNIAANVEDPGLVNWALISVRTASIGRHARDDSPVNLVDRRLCQKAAGRIGGRLQSVDREPVARLRSISGLLEMRSRAIAYGLLS